MNQAEIIHQKLQVAVALHNQGELDRAEAIYRQILSFDPNNFYALRFLGCLCRIKGAYVEGITFLTRAVSLRPEDADCLYNFGNILGNAGSHHQAVLVLERCLVLRDDFAEAKQSLGWSLFEIGEFHRAEEVLLSAVASNPALFQAWSNLGNVFNAQAKSYQAIASYRRAIELKPNFSDAYINLGTLLKEVGETDEAKKCFLSALKINPIQKTIFYQLFDLFLETSTDKCPSLLHTLSSAILQATSSQNIIAFGDSHVCVFDGIPGFEKVWVGAATAYNLINSYSSTKGREKIFKRLEFAIPDCTSVLLCFGEVDCRSHVLKQCIKSERSIDEVCEHVVSRYLQFVDQISSRGFTVILCGPYGSGTDHNDQGNAQERYYASLCFEKMLRDGAKDRGLSYFSLHGVLTNSISQETRVEFFEDGLHFPGHISDDISSDIKCVVLSRMLEAVNESYTLSMQSACPVVTETSLLGEKCLCLLDVFSDAHPKVYPIGLLPDATARVELLSKASHSIVIDLHACLNVEVVRLSSSVSSPKNIEIWGLDSNGIRADVVIDIHSLADDQMACVRFDARFPPRSMLRYLVVACPEGFLSTLMDFDVRGRSFVFSH